MQRQSLGRWGKKNKDVEVGQVAKGSHYTHMTSTIVSPAPAQPFDQSHTNEKSRFAPKKQL